MPILRKALFVHLVVHTFAGGGITEVAEIHQEYERLALSFEVERGTVLCGEAVHGRSATVREAATLRKLDIRQGAEVHVVIGKQTFARLYVDVEMEPFVSHLPYGDCRSVVLLNRKDRRFCGDSPQGSCRNYSDKESK